jgi:hypothetical protein
MESVEGLSFSPEVPSPIFLNGLVSDPQLGNESDSVFGRLLIQMFQFYKRSSRCFPSYILENLFQLSQEQNPTLEVDIDMDILPISSPPPFKFFTPAGEPLASLVYGLHPFGDEFYTFLFDFEAGKFNILIHHIEGQPLTNRLAMERIGPLFSEWLCSSYSTETQQPPPRLPLIGVQSCATTNPAFSALLVILQKIVNFTPTKANDYWRVGCRETIACLLEDYGQKTSVAPLVPPPVLATIERLEKYKTAKTVTDLIRLFTKYHLPQEEFERARGRARTQEDAVPLALYYLSEVGPNGKRKPVFHADIVAFLYRFQLVADHPSNKRDHSPKRTHSATTTGNKKLPGEAELKAKISQMNSVAFDDQRLPPHMQKLVKTTPSLEIGGITRARVFLAPTECGIRYAEFLLGFRDSPTGGMTSDLKKPNSTIVLELITKYGAMFRDEILHRLMAMHAENPDSVEEFNWQKVNLNLIWCANHGTIVSKDELFYLAKDPVTSLMLRSTLRNPIFQSPSTVSFDRLISGAVNDCFVQSTALSANEVFAILFPRPEFEQLKLPVLQSVLRKKCGGKRPSLFCFDNYYFRIPENNEPLTAEELYRQCSEGWVESSLLEKGFNLHPAAIQTAFKTGLFSPASRMLYAIDQELLLFVGDSELPVLNVGRGLFTKAEFPAGTLIEVTGHTQLRDPLDTRFLSHGFSFDLIGQIWEIDCKPLGKEVTCLAAYANDGRDMRAANMKQRLVDGLEGHLFMQVLERIPANTELFWDYGDDYWMAFEDEQPCEEVECWGSPHDQPTASPSFFLSENIRSVFDEDSSERMDYQEINWPLVENMGIVV